MNSFEMEFINDMKRLQLKRYQVCELLGMTMPTLKSKLKSPDTLTVGEVIALKKLNFKLLNLGI